MSAHEGMCAGSSCYVVKGQEALGWQDAESQNYDKIWEMSPLAQTLKTVLNYSQSYSFVSVSVSKTVLTIIASPTPL
jgi:hypothetical protein